MYQHETEEVIPLDIPLLRKTQRRVAALLRTANAVPLPCVRRKKQQGQPVYSKPLVNPFSWSHSPRPPNPSAASRVSGKEDYSDIRGLLNTLKPTVARNTSWQSRPHASSLPPLVDGLDKVKGHVSNVDTDRDPGDILPQMKLPDVKKNAANSSDSEKLHFPEINQHGSLVSMGGLGVNDGDQGSSSEIRSSLIKDATLERYISFISERTGGSLRMDEDYIPMSITITKLSQQDGRHSDLLSDSSDLLDNGQFEISDAVKRGSGAARRSPVSPVNTTNDWAPVSWCTCPKFVTSITPCPECRKMGGAHERWCTAVPNLCRMCKKPCRKHNSRTKLEPSSSYKSEDLQEEGKESVTSNARIIKKVSSKAEMRRQRETIDKYEKELNRASPRPSQNQRVRFHDENDQSELRKVPHPAITTDKDTHVGVVKNKDDGNSKICVQEEVRTETTDLNKNSHLGVDMHKTAYILALRDSMELKKMPKVKDKKKHHEMHVENAKTGTIFSYFTLLKRPHSDPPHNLNLGITQDFGVTVKDGMKHVFGKMNFSDYYPGGKRYRQL